MYFYSILCVCSKKIRIRETSQNKFPLFQRNKLVTTMSSVQVSAQPVKHVEVLVRKHRSR